MEQIDVAIVGCGPAGLSAAINAKRRGKSVKVFGAEVCSPKLESAPWVDNYLGIATTGPELGQMYLKHFESLGMKIFRTRVDAIVEAGNGFMLSAKGEIFEARTIIIATGTTQTHYLPGERDFVGKGVSYCGTCDGPLYRGKVVAVIGYTDEGLDEANYLATVAKQVYYLPVRNGTHNLNPSIEIIREKPLGILGETHLSKLILRGRELEVDGVFIFREATPVEQLIPSLAIANHSVLVDRQMATNIPGVYAAGDCTGGPYQLAKAVGEGLVAGLSAATYIDKQK